MTYKQVNIQYYAVQEMVAILGYLLFYIGKLPSREGMSRDLIGLNCISNISNTEIEKNLNKFICFRSVHENTTYIQMINICI